MDNLAVLDCTELYRTVLNCTEVKLRRYVYLRSPWWFDQNADNLTNCNTNCLGSKVNNNIHKCLGSRKPSECLAHDCLVFFQLL